MSGSYYLAYAAAYTDGELCTLRVRVPPSFNHMNVRSTSFVLLLLLLVPYIAICVLLVC